MSEDTTLFIRRINYQSYFSNMELMNRVSLLTSIEIRPEFLDRAFTLLISLKLCMLLHTAYCISISFFDNFRGNWPFGRDLETSVKLAEPSIYTKLLNV